MNKYKRIIGTVTGLLFLLSLALMLITLVMSVPVWIVTGNVNILAWSMVFVLFSIGFGVMYTKIDTIDEQ